jgi:small conductance mechanosensitive channel
MVPAIAEVSTRELTRACGEEPGFVCRRLLEWTGSEPVAEVGHWAIDVPARIALTALVALVATWILRRLIGRGLRRLNAAANGERIGAVRRGVPNALKATEETSIRAEQRIEALTSLLRSLVTFVIWLIAGIMILGELGLDLAPLIAGAGVIGIALGFGAQSLVKDFLSGIFILVEDQFGVGDNIDVDQQVSGICEGVSLRTTRLRSVDGTVWHVPNGEIRIVGNRSQIWSRSLLDLEVAYDTDIERAKEVIKTAADGYWKEESSILEEPEMWGVEQLGASAIVLRLVVKTTPSEQWRVSRELRQRIKQAFDADGIEIPFPQQTVWHRGGPPAPASEADAGGRG